MEATASMRRCERCGNPFGSDRRKPSAKNPLRFCSTACTNAARKGVSVGSGTFVTPDSTKAERIRANGLVNKRIKLGWFTRPTKCARCPADGRTDAHHGDYMQPGTVAFVCRSCHMREHHNPGYLKGCPTVSIDHRQDGQPIGTGRAHGRGGRKGTTGKPLTPRAALRRVIDCISNGDGTITDVLVCGHTAKRPDDGEGRAQRRCGTCRSAALSAALGSPAPTLLNNHDMAGGQDRGGQ